MPDQRNHPSKIAIHWVELFFLALLVILGMGVWVLAEKEVERRLKAEEPLEELYMLQADVPVLQAGQEGVRKDIETIRAKRVEGRLETASLRAALQALQEQHPELGSPALSAALTDRPKILEAYHQSVVDLETSQRLVQSLEISLSSLITRTAELSINLLDLTTPVTATAGLTATLAAPPGPVLQERRRAIAVIEAQLAWAQQELELTRERLIEERLKAAQSLASLEALEEIYPGMNAPGEGAAQTLSLSSETLGAYSQVQREIASASALDQALQQELMNQEAALSKQTDLLSRAKHSAELQFADAQKAYVNHKNWVTLGVSLGISILALLILTLLFMTLPSEKPLTDRWIASLIALGVLLILFGYQAFQVAGAALAGLMVLIVLALLALPKPARKTAATAPLEQKQGGG